MTSIDAAPDAVHRSKKSERSSSNNKEMGEGAEETSSPITDAVPANSIADTDGKSTSHNLSLMIKKEMMIKKGIPVKKAIVITAPLPRSTVTKQNEAVSLPKAKMIMATKHHLYHP